jgi:hypothetical protein
VQVKYDVAKENVAVQLWLHRSNTAENQAGLEYLRAHADDVEKILKGRPVEWRVQNTSILETKVNGIGWGVPQTDGKIAEVVEVVAGMLEIATKHKSGLRDAIDAAGMAN